jgi:peptidoglycan/xylan/chitin deacetylase (PgdA/CDA1 family)
VNRERILGLARRLRRWLAGSSADGRWLHRVRRVDRVAPVEGRRLVAITFDDGPTALAHRGRPVTETILRILERFGARATFNVIGTTGGNYPDEPGRPGTPLWNGRRFDHYPAFGLDRQAGAVNQPGLVRRILDAGHELGNHSYGHVAFGREWVVYRTRRFLPDARAALDDCRRLHDWVEAEFGYAMRLARPPHYVDRTADGRSAFDVYEALGYLYVGASVDLGGWRPSHRELTPRQAAERLRALLLEDPDALDGRILFAKDGLNMSLEAAVLDLLPAQLQVLEEFGYRVIPVGELLAAGPFTDVPPRDPVGAAAARLAAAGLPVAYRDNRLRPGGVLTRGELAALRAAPHVGPRLEGGTGGAPASDVPASHPYAGYVARCLERQWLDRSPDGRFHPARPATWEEVGRCFGLRVPPGRGPQPARRGEVLLALAGSGLTPGGGAD